MKQRLIAVLVSGLFAIPALAGNDPVNAEINAGNLPPSITPTLTREQVQAALVAAHRAGQVVVNAELGTMTKQPAPPAGKTREQVREEILKEQRAGRWFVLGQRG